MVAAWINAEIGVGPSIASGNQTWSGNCADLPTAPQKMSSAETVRCWLRSKSASTVPKPVPRQRDRLRPSAPVRSVKLPRGPRSQRVLVSSAT